MPQNDQVKPHFQQHFLVKNPDYWPEVLPELPAEIPRFSFSSKPVEEDGDGLEEEDADLFNDDEQMLDAELLDELDERAASDAGDGMGGTGEEESDDEDGGGAKGACFCGKPDDEAMVSCSNPEHEDYWVHRQCVSLGPPSPGK